MTIRVVAAVLMLVALGISPATAGTPSVDGFFGFGQEALNPIVAVLLDVPEGHAVAGVRWVHNDELSQPFGYIIAAEPGAFPNLAGAVVIAETAEWASQGWSEFTFAEHATSTTSKLWLVLEFPVGSAHTADGLGGGSAVGYLWKKRGNPIAISDGGSAWSWVHSGISPAVEVVLGELGEAIELEPAPIAARALQSDSLAEHPQRGNLGSILELQPAHPNPFNPRTELAFSLAEAGNVEFAIYDVRGQLVRSLRAGAYPAGNYRVTWDGTSNAGRRVASGVYFARLTSAGRSLVQRLALVK